MIYLWPFISALIPIFALIVYIYWCDKHSPEPISQLIKATMYGVLSIFLSLCMSIPAQYMGLYPEDPANFIDGIRTAFRGHADGVPVTEIGLEVTGGDADLLHPIPSCFPNKSGLLSA